MTTTNTNHVPDYITPGATVAVYWHSAGASNASCSTGTVTKVNKASVTVERRAGQAARYQFAKLPAEPFDGAPNRRYGGTWGTTEYLLPLNHPKVIATRARQRASNLAEKVVTAANDLRRDPENPDLIAAVQAAAAALTGE